MPDWYKGFYAGLSISIINALLALLMVMLLNSCGSMDDAGTCVFEGCEKEIVPKNGQDGKNGAVGKIGAHGTPGREGAKGDTGVAGPKGDTGETGSTGPMGNAGPKGDIGPTGESGLSCTVYQMPSSAVIECPNGSTAVIVNGEDGENGISPVIEVIDPCGPNSPSYDNEVILRLPNGELYAWLKNTGNVLLVPGNWQTTDSQKCNFTITQAGEVIY